MATRNRYRSGYGSGTDPKVATGELRGYSPNPVPEEGGDLRRYIDYELRAIRDAIEELVYYEPEDWIAPSLINSWADGGTDPGYYYDRGRVYIKGDYATGTSGTVAFNLPEGYRPPQDMYFPILLTGAATGGYILIDTDGDVYITRGAAATATLNGISFRI